MMTITKTIKKIKNHKLNVEELKKEKLDASLKKSQNEENIIKVMIKQEIVKVKKNNTHLMKLLKRLEYLKNL